VILKQVNFVAGLGTCTAITLCSSLSKYIVILNVSDDKVAYTFHRSVTI